MHATVVGLVTPHLLRVVDLANEALRRVNRMEVSLGRRVPWPWGW